MIAGLVKAKRNYNPSLVSTGEGFLLAYRSEADNSTVSEIVIAELDSKKTVLSNARLKVPGVTREHSLEDPRLFWFGGHLHVAFSVAKYGLAHGWKCVQAYGRLVKKGRQWTLPQVWYPEHGCNDWSAKEKNWSFFEAEGSLRCIYDMSATGFVVLEIEDDVVVKEWRHPPISWRWGRASGGTPPVDWDGQKLVMFHSWEKHPRRHRLYHMAFLTFAATAPHQPLLVSRQPVLTAQEDWGFPEGETWAPLCVFPGGLEVRNGRALVSYGKNDQEIGVDVFRIEQMGRIAPRQTFQGEQRVRLLADIMVNGQPAWSGTEVAVLAHEAATLVARGRAVPL